MKEQKLINPFAALEDAGSEHPKKEAPYSKQELRDLLFSQDKRLLKAARDFAQAIQDLPQDPNYPNTKPRALLNGGFIRDAILGKKAKDVDLEIYGVSPENLMAVLRRLYPKMGLFGKSFAIIKVTVALGLDLDIALPRREKKVGDTRQEFEIESDPAMTLEEATSRRDFTINAMLADPFTGEVYDLHNGLQDLHDRVLRITDPVRFEEDELRVLRGVQFAARMNLTVEPESWKQLTRIVEQGKLKKLSSERVRDEITKLLIKGVKPSKGLELMRDLGILKQEYPVFSRMAEAATNGDQTWKTLLRRVDTAASIIKQDSLANDPAKMRVMLAALCADLVEAPTNVVRTSVVQTETAKKGKPRSPAMALLKGTWNHSNDDAESVIGATRERHQPNAIFEVWQRKMIDDQNYANFVRMLLKRLDPGSVDELLAVAEAEWRTTNETEPNTSYLPGEKLRAIIAEYNLDTANPKKTLLSGSELQELGVPTGPRIGKILQAIEDLRDAGKIVTHDEALEEAKLLKSFPIRK